jgi:hypothetical protein
MKIKIIKTSTFNKALELAERKGFERGRKYECGKAVREKIADAWDFLKDECYQQKVIHQDPGAKSMGGKPR